MYIRNGQTDRLRTTIVP